MMETDTLPPGTHVGVLTFGTSSLSTHPSRATSWLRYVIGTALGLV